VIGLLEPEAIETSKWITRRVSFGEEAITDFQGWLDPKTGFIKA